MRLSLGAPSPPTSLPEGEGSTSHSLSLESSSCALSPWERVGMRASPLAGLVARRAHQRGRVLAPARALDAPGGVRVGVARVGVWVQVTAVAPDAAGLLVIMLERERRGGAPIALIDAQRPIQHHGIDRPVAEQRTD